MSIHILGSTGPKSLAGKNRSRMNALKHGGYAKTKILPFESEAEYKRLSKSMYDSFAPDDFAQRDLVQKMVDCLWVIERLQLQAGYRRDEFFKELTPKKLAEGLGMDERFIKHAPDYWIDPNFKLKRFNRSLYATLLGEYEDLMIKAKDVNNFDVVWRNFQTLFEGLHEWLPKHDDRLPLLIASHGKNLSIEWQNHPKHLLNLMEIYISEIYYAYYFDECRSEIRVIMASWFFLNKASHQSDHVSNELIMKHQRAYQSLIDSYTKLRKSRDEHLLFLDKLAAMRESASAHK